MELDHGANWMRSAIPNFSKLIQPLHELLEYLYSGNKTRKKSRIASKPIKNWKEKHKSAFESLVEAISNQISLSIPDYRKLLFVFTNASSTHRAGILTQVDPKEV